MPPMHRRRFLSSAIAASALPPLRAAARTTVLDETLRSGIARRHIPAVVGMVAGPNSTLYSGAFGIRDSSGVAVKADSIFAIASMTKPITTAAALQLVEQGKAGLDEPVGRYLPSFNKIQVLQGFDADGNPVLRAALKPPTLRHLLTHTSGFCFDLWDGDMFRYSSKTKPGAEGVPGPLMFEPGTRWQYGQGIEWAGRLVEAVSGMTLEDYFQQRILRPLGMVDTSYVLPPDKFDRLVSVYQRSETGELRQQGPRKQPAAPKSFNGGGGLYSTAADYVRFMQMILHDGAGPDGVSILQARSVASMKQNQIGALTAGKMKTFQPEVSGDVDMQPGQTEKWGLGFLINTTPYAGGRSAGSLAWAGFFNTFFWIDPQRSLSAVILMQFLPFVDRDAVAMLDNFEHAVYESRLG